MAILNCSLWLLVGLVLAITRAVPSRPQQQVVLNPGPIIKSSPNLNDHEERLLRVTVDFDSIDMTKNATKPLSSHHYLEFNQFELVNTTAAIDSGFLNKSDSDCAVSSPNAIHSVRLDHPSPAFFKSNPKALADINMSQYFDFVGIAAKPLMANWTYGFMEINAWQIDDDKNAKSFDSMGVMFFNQQGSFAPIEFEPRAYFEGWGYKVNYMEFSASLMDDDDNEEPWHFCLDNIIVDYHRAGEDGYE